MPGVLLRAGNAAGFQVAGNLRLAQPQVLLRDDDKAVLDVRGHQPRRNGAAADEDKPQVLPPGPVGNLLPLLLALQLVEAVNHHNPAGLFACRCPRPLGQNGPVLPGQVPAGEPGIALSGQKLPYQLGFAIAGGPVKIDGLGHPAGRLELAQRCRRSNITLLQACLPPFG